jgi:hypothetical protein
LRKSQGETSDVISINVLKENANYDSETKIIRVSADNANKNIGGFSGGVKIM